jgi:hypothetical protein
MCCEAYSFHWRRFHLLEAYVIPATLDNVTQYELVEV